VTDTLLQARALAAQLLDTAERRAPAPRDLLLVGDVLLLQLSELLGLWFGADGVQALFARAINRASTEHPMLAEVRSAPLEGCHLDGVRSRSRIESPEALREALLHLLTTLLALLARLVGEDLVLLVVRQVGTEDADRGRPPIQPRKGVDE
jgi:hypothetical protein